MSKKGKISIRSSLSQEELEIQKVLSPADQRSISNANPNESIVVAPVTQQPSISKDAMKDLALVVSNTLVDVLEDRGILPNTDEDTDDTENEEDIYPGQGEVLRELPTGRPCHTDDNNDKMFGVDINENPHHTTTVADIHCPPFISSNSVDPNPPASVAHPLISPDKSLPPVISTRAPTNWYPDPQVMAWASEMVDQSEWTSADRDIIKKQFSPDSEFDHIFSAVMPPTGMLSAIQSPEMKKKDFLFRRAETEEFLLEANKDLVCGFRPMIEVLSNLKDDPSQEGNRILLARVFQCMASSAIHISRGRRELGRRFVNFANMEALYRSKPSHYTFFGDSSVDTAVTKAVAESKINKDLIVMPKKRKYNRYNQSGNYYNKDGNQFFRTNSFNQNKRGRFQGQRGRGGRNSRRRGKPQQKSTATETTSQK